MAGPTVKEILLRWSIDLTNVNSAIASLETRMDQLFSKQKAQSAAGTQAIKDQGALYKSEVVDPAIEASVKLQAQLAREKMSADAVRAARQGVVDLLRQEIGVMSAKQGMSTQELSGLRRVTSELEKQQRLMSQQKTVAKSGGAIGGLVEGFSSRLAGTIGFAVLSAEGMGRVLEEASQKFKEFIISTGPLIQVQEQFQKLAKTQGIAPTKFINDLRDATHGLVADTELFRTANLALQQGLGSNKDDIIKLTQATVGLARAQGKDAKTAVEALDTFLTTGYARSLSRVTGIQSQMLTGVRNLGGGFDQSARMTLNFKQALDLITRQYEAVGEPALTYVDRVNQLSNAENRFFEEIAIGLQKSSGFKIFLDGIGEATEKISELTEGAASWGDKFGLAFAAVSEGVKAFVAWATVRLKAWQDLFKVMGSGAAADSIRARFTTLTGILGSLTEGLIVSRTAAVLLSDGLELLANVAIAAATLNIKKLNTALQDFRHTAAVDLMGGVNDIKKIEDIMSGKKEVEYKLTYTAPVTGSTELQEMEAEKRMAKVKEELALKTSQIILKQTENRIKREQELVQTQYDQGLLSERKYMEERGRLEDERFQATLRHTQEEYEAKRDALAKETELEKLAATITLNKAKLDFANQQSALQDQLKEKLSDLERGVGAVPGTGPTEQKTGFDTSVHEYGTSTDRFGLHVDKFGEIVTGKKPETEGTKKQTSSDARQHKGVLQALTSGFDYLFHREAQIQEPLIKEAEKPKPQTPTQQQTQERRFLVSPPAGYQGQVPTTGPNAGKVELPESQVKANLLSQYQTIIKLAQTNMAAASKMAQASLAEIAAKGKVLQLDSQSESEKAVSAHLDILKQLTNTYLQEEISAREKTYETTGKLAKDDVERQRQLNEFNYQQNTITAQEYIDNQVKFADEEYEITRDLEEKKLAAHKDSATAQAAYIDAMSTASAQKEKVLTTLSIQDWQIRAKGVEDAYGGVTKVFEQQLSFQKEQTPFVGEDASAAAQIPILQQIIELKQHQLVDEQKLLDQTQEGTANWFKQLDAVQKVNAGILTYQKELIEAQSSLKGISTAFSQLSSGFGAFDLRGRIGTRLKTMSEALSQASQQMSQFQQAHQTAMMAEAGAGRSTEGILGRFGFGRRVPPLATGMTAAQAEAAKGTIPSDLTKSTDSINKALDSTGTEINDWKSKVTSMSEVIQQAIDRINSALANSKALESTAPQASQEYLQNLVPSEDFGSMKPPQLAVGGSIAESGLAIVHAGEQVVPAAVTAALQNLAAIVQKVASAFSTMAASMTKLNAPVKPTDAQLQPQQFGPASTPKAPQQPAQPQNPIQAFQLGGIAGAVQYLLNPPSTTPITSGASGPATAANPQGSITASDLFGANASAHSDSDSMDSAGGDEAYVSALTANTAAVTGNTTAHTQSAQSKDGGAGGQGGSGTDSSSMDSQLQAGVGIVMQGMQAVGGMMSAISGQGGPMKAGMTGAAAGASIGSLIMPGIGTAIGAAAGLITGIFAGAAEAATQKLANQMSEQFNQAIGNIKEGTQTLVGGIQQTQELMAATVSQLTGRKGGTQELNAILPQMQQQLNALQQQQQQALTSFQSQLEVLNAPVQYSDSLNAINQIITAYQQYIQAGGSVTDANEYLQQSFSNLAEQGVQQLNQDEQDAINNALNYNNLLLQRQNLIQSTNQQIQNIMSQGVAVQQMPEGVSKAEQIEQVSQNAQIQLDQLNEQISASDYELQNQQQIFNLATTRIGLENQLLVLQNQQTGLQTQQVEALGNVVSSLSTALPTSMPAALQQLGLGSAYVAPTAAQAPTPPVKTGIQSVDLANEMQYQQQLAYYNAQVNQPLGYINPAGTAAGTATTGTANELTPTVPGSVPTTTPIPTQYGTGTVGGTGNLTTQQMLSLISGTVIGQPIGGAAPAYTAGTPGTGVSGSPNLNPGNLPTTDLSGLTVNSTQVDTVSTTSGQALLVTMAPASATSGTKTLSPIGEQVGSTTSATAPTASTQYTTAQATAPSTQYTTEPIYGYPGGGTGPTQVNPNAPPATAPTPVGYNLSTPTQLPSNILQPTTISTGPGTTETVGIIGTATSVAQAMNNTFSALAGLPQQIVNAITPSTSGLVPTGPTAPVTSQQPSIGGLVGTGNLVGTGPSAPVPYSPATAQQTPEQILGVSTLNQVSQIVSAATQMTPQLQQVMTSLQQTQTKLQSSPNVNASLLGPIISQSVQGMITHLQSLSPATTAVGQKPSIGGLVGTGNLVGVGPSAPVPFSPVGNQYSTEQATTPVSSGTSGSTSSEALSAQAMVAVNAQTSLATQRLSIEGQINQLSSTRVTSETQLVSLKMQEIQADMQRVQAWQTLINNSQAAGSTSGTLESQMNATYNNRARQGLGGFYGEVSNPV